MKLPRPFGRGNRPAGREPEEPADVRPPEPGTKGLPPPAEEPLGEEGQTVQGESPPSAPSPPPTGIVGTVRAVVAALSHVGKRRVAAAVLVLGGATAALVIGLAGFSFWWTSQPSFCGRCHVMKPFIQAWTTSPHKDVKCETCHLSPGLYGFVGGKISSLQVVANYVRGNYKDWSFNAAVANENCLQCHESIMAADVHAKGITVSHKNIIGMGAKCIFCHSTVAHGSAVPVGSQTHPTMATCLKCHNDKIAPLRCNLCHTQPPASAAKLPEQGGG